MFETYETLIHGLLEKGFGSVDHWLSTEVLIGLRKSLLLRYNDDLFHSAGIGNKDNLQMIKKIRNDHIYWLDAAIANPFEKEFLQKVQGFVNHLNQTCFAGIDNFEFQYAVYEKGSFYKKHVDRFMNDNKRQFSLVFYLSEAWHPGDGGELLLYSDAMITTIQPIPGRIVVFRSDLPHEVVTSNIQRLSLTGWMKSI